MTECPRCHQGTKLEKLKDVEVEACPGCGGLLLDKGELNRVAESTSGDLEYSTLHMESFEHSDAYPPVTCPTCRAIEMKKVEFNVHSGIILDYCPGCECFWLDAHELERIDEEVRRLNESDDESDDTPMSWFTAFLSGLPR